MQYAFSQLVMAVVEREVKPFGTPSLSKFAYLCLIGVPTALVGASKACAR